MSILYACIARCKVKTLLGYAVRSSDYGRSVFGIGTDHPPGAPGFYLRHPTPAYLTEVDPQKRKIEGI